MVIGSKPLLTTRFSFVPLSFVILKGRVCDSSVYRRCSFKLPRVIGRSKEIENKRKESKILKPGAEYNSSVNFHVTKVTKILITKL